MAVVVDASVAAKWLIAESDSAIAAGLLDGSCDLHAPRLLASEIANLLWRKVLKGFLDEYEAVRLAAGLLAMPLKWSDDQALCLEALRIAVKLGHPAFDCMYLALALRIGGTVVTADKRFVSAVASTEYKPVVVPLWQFFGNVDDALVHLRTP